MNQSTQLMTSLDEIKSFNPCSSGWRDILKGQDKTESDSVQFPLIDCLNSNSFGDICWLLGKRNKEKEYKIYVKAARMCANSVKHLNNVYASDAASDAAYAAYASSTVAYASDASTDASDAYAVASTAASDASDASTAAYAYASSSTAAAAAAAYAVAYKKQKELNFSFLKQCILEYENGEL